MDEDKLKLNAQELTDKFLNSKPEKKPVEENWSDFRDNMHNLITGLSPVNLASPG